MAAAPDERPRPAETEAGAPTDSVDGCRYARLAVALAQIGRAPAAAGAAS